MRCLENNKSHSCCGAARQAIKESLLCAALYHLIGRSLEFISSSRKNRDDGLHIFKRKKSSLIFVAKQKFPAIFELSNIKKESEDPLNFACRQNRDDILFDGFAKVFALALFFFLIATTETLASQTWDCGDQGGNVKCTLNDNGTFTVSGSGKMADYGYINMDFAPVSAAPWGGDRNVMSAIKNIVIEEGVTSVGEWAFAGATSAKSIYMPSVKDVSERSFYDVYGVENVYMPNVETIGEYGFGFAFSLKSVDMPNIKEIGDYAFGSPWDNNVIPLSYVGLPNDVVLGSGVFGNSTVSSCGTDGGTCVVCAENENYMPDVGCVADCGSGFLVRNRFCVSADEGCGNTYFADGAQCQRCSAGCQTCDNTETCDVCSEENLMKNSVCVADCGNGYRAESGTCVMKTCDDYGELSVCEDSVSGCTKQVCTAGTTLANGTSCYVQQPQSIAPSCGENAHLVDNESTCKCVCNSGYTGDGATCTAINCNAGEYWNGEQCTACNEGEYSAGGFVTECSANTAEHCASKSNTANVCASCAANYFMDGTTCTAINCSAGEFFDMSAKVCTPCVEGEWNNVAAATSCMPNTAANCATFSKTANVCASCAAKFKFADNECVMMTCAEVYPDSSDTQCESSVSGCSVTTCSEVGSLADGTPCYRAATVDHTPNCDRNATLTGEGSSCACVCNSGFEGSGTTCTAISCPAGKYLDGSECKPCAAGSYAGAGDNVCSSCGAHEYSAAGASSCSPRNNMSNCSSFATDSDECTSCKTGYKSENGGCVSMCSGGKVYWDGKCYDEYPFAKKRYTPAEADQWLKDDGNIVTLIFKK